jgi:hypothetical protein
MDKNQSLKDIIDNEDPIWLATIMDSSDRGFLNLKLSKARKPERKAIINARISNLNYLIS